MSFRLTNLWKSRHPRRPAPALHGRRNPVRPLLEALEDRVTPAILVTDQYVASMQANVVNPPGSRINSPQINLVFWGSGWTGQTQWSNDIAHAIDNLVASHYFNGLTQYGDAGTAAHIGNYFVTPTGAAQFADPPALSTGGYGINKEVTGPMLQATIGHGVAAPVTDAIYIVIGQPGTHGNAGAGAVGEHDSTTVNGQTITYAWIHNPGTGESPANVDDVTDIISHEVDEAATDADGNSGIRLTGPDPSIATGDNEICDPSTALGSIYRYNGTLAQAYYSQADHAYLLPTGQQQNFLVNTSAVNGNRDNVLTVNGDQLANKNDFLAIGTSTAGGVQLNLNGEVVTFEPGFINEIHVNLGTGNDTVTLDSTPAGVSTTINQGGGTDTVTLPFGLNPIQGPVTVNGGSGTDTLNVNDQGRSSNDTYTVTASTLKDSASATLTYNGQNSVFLNTSTGTDTVNVPSTASGFFTKIIANGPCTVNVGANGSVQGISGTLAIEDPPNFTTLRLDDSADPAGRTVTLSSFAGSDGTYGHVTGLAPAPIDYRFGDFNSVTLDAGTGATTVNVQAVGVPTNVVGNGTTTINVGNRGSVQGIASTLTLENPAAFNAITVDDSADSTSRTVFLYTLGTNPVDSESNGDPWGTLTGLAPAAINFEYADTGSLTLKTGTGADAIIAQAIRVPTTLVVQGTSSNFIEVGSSANTVQTVIAPLTVTGTGVASSNEVLLFDNGNTTSADQLTARSTGVTSNAPGSFFGVGGSLSYSGLGTVVIDTSSAAKGSGITVFPASGMVFKINGGGQPAAPGNSLTVQPFNGTVLTQHSTGTGAGSYTLPGGGTALVSYTDMQSVTPVGLLAVGSGPGLAPEVQVYDPQNGAQKYDLHPFTGDFQGGVRVAVGDVNGDGIPDIVTAQGPGGGTVQVFDGSTGLPLAGPLGSFTPFGPNYSLGLWVAVADVNRDGFADVLVGQDAGGQPEVRVYSGRDGSLLADFLAFDKSFQGGVRVAAAVIAGQADVITGQGPGGEAVNVFTGASLNLQNSTPTPTFTIAQPFGPAYSGGVYVGTGGVFGDGVAKILVGQGTGRDPQVGVFDARAQGNELKRFVAYGFPNGVTVAAADLNGDSRADVIAAEAQGGSNVRAYDGLSLQEDGHLNAFAPPYQGGVFVGGFGHWGDFANLAGRTTGGTQGILQTTLVDLTNLQTTLANPGLGAALDALYTAFNSPDWQDNAHLDAGGRAVFAELRLGVDALAGLTQSGPGAVPVLRLEQDIGQILRVEETLVLTALIQAAQTNPRALPPATGEYVTGLIEATLAFIGGRVNPFLLDGAMDHFLNAWQDLQ